MISKPLVLLCFDWFWVMSTPYVTLHPTFICKVISKPLVLQAQTHNVQILSSSDCMSRYTIDITGLSRLTFHNTFSFGFSFSCWFPPHLHQVLLNNLHVNYCHLWFFDQRNFNLEGLSIRVQFGTWRPGLGLIFVTKHPIGFDQSLISCI